MRVAIWPEPLIPYGCGSGLVCVKAVDEPEDRSIGDSIRRLLGPRELIQWEALKKRAVPKRIADWERGRCAAKEAVTHIAREAGVELAPAEVEIIPDQWGRPAVEGIALSRAGLSPAVSISHSGAAAVALAAPASSTLPSSSMLMETLVGIDVELAARTAEGVREIVFHPAEGEMIETIDPSLKKEWTLRLWCAKEAAGKAIGRGFSAGFKALEVTQIDRESGKVQVELRGRLAEECPELRGRPLPAHTSIVGDLIVSSVVWAISPRGRA